MRKTLASLYSKAKGRESDAAEGSRKRARGRPRGGGRGRGKGGGGRRPESPVPSAPSGSDSLPSAHSASEEEVEVEEGAGVEEEAGVEQEAGGTSSSTSSRVWLRGPSSLPRRPIPSERRPLIRPDGER